MSSYELNSTQMELELLREDKEFLINDSMNFIADVIADLDLDDPMEQSIYDYLTADNIEETVFKMVGKVLLKRKMSSQALIGIIYKKLTQYDNYHTIANIMLNAVEASSQIKVTYSRAYIYFQAVNKLPKDIAEKHHKLTYVLPSPRAPMIIDNNHTIGYQYIKESIICGGSLKHHNKHLNLKHINRLNSTPYRMENRLQFLIQPKFDAEPKMKDNGEYETDKDISKRFQSFTTIVNQLPDVAKQLAEMGNKFYIHHKFDNGGRTYAKAHHCNYQGMSYCKGLIQSYTKQLVEEEW